MLVKETHRKARSVDEEQKFLAAQVCSCGGKFQKKRQLHVRHRWTGQRYDVLRCSCDKCGQQRAFWFDISDLYGLAG